MSESEFWVKQFKHFFITICFLMTLFAGCEQSTEYSRASAEKAQLTTMSSMVNNGTTAREAACATNYRNDDIYCLNK